MRLAKRIVDWWNAGDDPWLGYDMPTYDNSICKCVPPSFGDGVDHMARCPKCGGRVNYMSKPEITLYREGANIEAPPPSNYRRRGLFALRR